MTTTRSFASDNNASVHPEVMAAIQKANEGHVVAYGDDHFTKRAEEKFKEQFGQDIDVFFVFNGTAANVLSLKSATQPFHAVICSEYAHINVDECGAPERLTGCKLLPIANSDGKLTPELIKTKLHGIGDQHHVQPKVISITQTTELGTVYSVDEIKTISKFARENGLILHVDGARISNAAASLGLNLRQITRDCGVDVLSFGGTKNGLLYGEAVVFFNRKLAENFKYHRKQLMQLSSKMRFVAVQFEALLTNDLWLRAAKHSNDMAQKLARALESIPQVRLIQKTQANGVFAQVPREIIEPLQKKFFFYVWDTPGNQVRWMASHDTQESDIQCFVQEIKTLIN